MNFNVTDVTKALQKLEEKELTIRKLSGFTLDDIIQMLAKGFKLITPTADVVEVVRCKDCVKRGLTECPMLIINIDLGGIVCRDDCFCSYGERREK